MGGGGVEWLWQERLGHHQAADFCPTNLAWAAASCSGGQGSGQGSLEQPTFPRLLGPQKFRGACVLGGSGAEARALDVMFWGACQLLGHS